MGTDRNIFLTILQRHQVNRPQTFYFSDEAAGQAHPVPSSSFEPVEPQVAQAIEALMVISQNADTRYVSTIPTLLQFARTCYDHMAGHWLYNCTVGAD